MNTTLKKTTSIAALLLLAACGAESGDAKGPASASALPVGTGSGDSALQKDLADPAPAGTLALSVETLSLIHISEPTRPY